jgi:hypothetical protein
MDQITRSARAGALRVSKLPVAHHPCATGNLIPAAWYPQRTGHALRVTKFGALRVAVFLVVKFYYIWGSLYFLWTSIIDPNFIQKKI